MNAEDCEKLIEQINANSKTVDTYKFLLRNCKEIEDAIKAIIKIGEETPLKEGLAYLKLGPVESRDININFFGHLKIGELKEPLLDILNKRLAKYQDQIDKL